VASFSACARRARATLVRTTFGRPMRCLLTRPARSRLATCFCTAAKLIGCRGQVGYALIPADRAAHDVRASGVTHAWATPSVSGPPARGPSYLSRRVESPLIRRAT
jgi:hypothetical protein